MITKFPEVICDNIAIVGALAVIFLVFGAAVRLVSFPDSVVEAAWKRAKGRCECRRTTHDHTIPHGIQLTWGNRGREGKGAWEAHHKVRGGSDTVSNCEILFWDCHKKTF